MTTLQNYGSIMILSTTFPVIVFCPVKVPGLNMAPGIQYTSRFMIYTAVWTGCIDFRDVYLVACQVNITFTELMCSCVNW